MHRTGQIVPEMSNSCRPSSGIEDVDEPHGKKGIRHLKSQRQENEVSGGCGGKLGTCLENVHPFNIFQKKSFISCERSINKHPMRYFSVVRQQSSETVYTVRGRAAAIVNRGDGSDMQNA